MHGIYFFLRSEVVVKHFESVCIIFDAFSTVDIILFPLNHEFKQHTEVKAQKSNNLIHI